jgi:hypothetical protein
MRTRVGRIYGVCVSTSSFLYVRVGFFKRCLGKGTSSLDRIGGLVGKT